MEQPVGLYDFVTDTFDARFHFVAVDKLLFSSDGSCKMLQYAVITIV